jgi:hypothetical protein
MEGLLIILVDLVAEALVGIAVVSGGLLLSSLGAIFSVLADIAMALVGTLFNRRAADGTRQQNPAQVGTLLETPVAPSTHKPGTPRWIRWLVIASLSLLGLAIAAALVINTWFVDDLLRWALARQERQSGVHVECETIAASLWSGRYELSGVRVTRSNHPAGEIDLFARSVAVRLPFWSAWKRTVPIHSLRVDGLRGRYYLGRQAEQKGLQPEDALRHRFSPDFERKPARHFAIDSAGSHRPGSRSHRSHPAQTIGSANHDYTHDTVAIA